MNLIEHRTEKKRSRKPSQSYRHLEFCSRQSTRETTRGRIGGRVGGGVSCDLIGAELLNW